MAVGNGKPSTTLKDITRTDDPFTRRAAGESSGDAEVRATKLFKQVAPAVATSAVFAMSEGGRMYLALIREDATAEKFEISVAKRAEIMNAIEQTMNAEIRRG